MSRSSPDDASCLYVSPSRRAPSFRPSSSALAMNSDDRTTILFSRRLLHLLRASRWSRDSVRYALFSPGYPHRTLAREGDDVRRCVCCVRQTNSLSPSRRLLSRAHFFSFPIHKALWIPLNNLVSASDQNSVEVKCTSKHFFTRILDRFSISSCSFHPSLVLLVSARCALFLLFLPFYCFFRYSTGLS